MPSGLRSRGTLFCVDSHLLVLGTRILSLLHPVLCRTSRSAAEALAIVRRDSTPYGIRHRDNFCAAVTL